MHLKTRNVETAFKDLVEIFDTGDTVGYYNQGVHTLTVPVVKRPSRNGNVLMIDEPVTITYSHPRERVLFNAARDANPFFHLYESLWMLAGRNDVAPLVFYAKKMADFSDDGKTLNGAYGYRWRHGEGLRDDPDPQTNETTDQLDVIVAHLKADPNSRRAVLQMWNVEDDLLKIGMLPADSQWINLTKGSKDVCCNLSVMFSLREREFDPESAVSPNTAPHDDRRTLDMTVTNRSNDMIWGALGANYVHFTMLQEYMANCLGVEMGKYHHFSNNLHVYDWNWKPKEWLEADDGTIQSCDPILVPTIQLVRDKDVFDREVKQLVEYHSVDRASKSDQEIYEPTFTEPFLKNVASPMCWAWHCHKIKEYRVAMSFMLLVKDPVWREAGIRWLRRRKDKKKEVKS